MKMLLAPFIAFRYIFSRKEQRFISFISLTSWLGLILGVVAMIVVLSVMNGFSRELQQRILRVIPHGYIEWTSDAVDWQDHRQQILLEEGIEAAAPLIDGRILLTMGERVIAAELQGISPSMEAGVSDISKSMIKGSLEQITPGGFDVILGYQLAQKLGVNVGDSVKILLPDVFMTPAGIFARQKKFTVVGVFHVGASPDATLAMTDLSSAAKLFKKIDTDGSPKIQKLRIKTNGIYEADSILKKLSAHNKTNGIIVSSWEDYNRALFNAIKMERKVVSLLLFAIIAVAVFNIASILVMMVSEKRKDIAILQVMGMEAKKITYIFMAQGMLIGLLGIFGGVLLGSLVAVYLAELSSILEHLLNSSLFGSSFYITDLPSYFKVEDAVIVSVVAFLLCILSAAYPAWRASKIEPISSLND